MAKPQIVAAPNRGNYSVKGTPQGITIPKLPVAGSLVKGKAGVDFVYRPKGPKGAGYYKKAKPTPSIAGSQPMTGTNASGATIATPPAATVAPATPFNWGNAYTANAQYQSTSPILAAGQNQIGESSGLVMRRDTNSSSPTYGQPIYRLPSESAGSGSVIASMGPDGGFVYKDAAGNAVDVKGLKIDYVPVASGQEGYLQGALGGAAAQSEVAQKSIANAAAQSGARRSGMRAQGALAETGNLQGTQAGITQRAQGEYTANLGKWAELYKSIYGELLPNAAAMAPAPEVPAAPAAPVAPVTPPVDTASSGSGFVKTVTPGASGALKGGAFTDLIGNITLPRNTSDKAIREALNNVLTSTKYKLTAQQKAYIKSLITGRYKGNKKY
jgi:hypothetical protein